MSRDHPPDVQCRRDRDSADVLAALSGPTAHRRYMEQPVCRGARPIVERHDDRVDRSELAAAIHTTSLLVGTFQLRSGRTASEYFDKYRFESDPRLLRAIAEHASDHIPPDTEVTGLRLPADAAPATRM
jgi:hypothetical protein